MWSWIMETTDNVYLYPNALPYNNVVEFIAAYHA